MDQNDNRFSLLRLLAESELQRRNKNQKTANKEISSDDINGITEMVKESIGDQTITIEGEPYTINAMEMENDSILLWLWSDSADDEKTIKITLQVNELEVDDSYWGDDNG